MTRRGGRESFDPDRLTAVLRQRWSGPDGARAARAVALIERAGSDVIPAEDEAGPHRTFDLDAAVSQLRQAGRVRQHLDEDDADAREPRDVAGTVVFPESGVKPDRRAMAEAGDREGLELERKWVLRQIGWSDGVLLDQPATWPRATKFIPRPVVALDIARRPVTDAVPHSYLVSLARLLDDFESGQRAVDGSQ